ncbi:MAG: hypothetical protein WKF35_05605 [Ferruginibacter sp.]
MLKNLLPFFLVSAILFFSCKKDGFITSPDARINIADTIKFDTVFTTAGSVTRSFKIFNDNDQRLLISTIKLMGGNTSPFKININGMPADEIRDLEIASNDSIYVFVKVTINPSSANLPFIIRDSILINYNGNTRFVQLEAFGQNANFLRNTIVSGSVNWNKTLPYVILGSILIDTAATLTIDAGTKIYMHADAPFIVDGTLLLNGTKNNKIIFTGDRLDEPYRNFPASWPGIYLRNRSRNNFFIYAEIKNAYQAVVVLGPTLNANPKLKMQQVIIDNAFDAGLLCVNSSADINNSLISNCGTNILVQAGGNYSFTHCTVASYSTRYLLHSKPVLSVSDEGFVNGNLFYSSLNASFKNCIFWGDNNVNNEVVVNKKGTNPFIVTFDYSLYKAMNDPANSIFNAVIKNADPLFDSIDLNKNIFDFRITKNPQAPGVNKGVVTMFTKDLDDNPRNIGIPDMGSYEKP